MFTVYCTVGSLHFILYTVECTVETFLSNFTIQMVNCTLYVVYGTLYTEQFALYLMQGTFKAVHSLL